MICTCCVSKDATFSHRKFCDVIVRPQEATRKITPWVSFKFLSENDECDFDMFWKLLKLSQYFTVGNSNGIFWHRIAIEYRIIWNQTYWMHLSLRSMSLSTSLMSSSMARSPFPYYIIFYFGAPLLRSVGWKVFNQLYRSIH